MSYWVGPLRGNCGLSVWTGNTDVCQEHPQSFGFMRTAQWAIQLLVMLDLLSGPRAGGP